MMAVSLSAQEPATSGRTHVVKAGDSLWELARQYLNDPFLWTELYRLNKGTIEDPRNLPAGLELRLPAPAAIDAAVVQAKSPVAVPPSDGQRPASFASSAGGRPAAVKMAASEQPAGATIFSRLLKGDEQARLSLLAIAAPARAVRAGEFYSAPFVERARGTPVRGRIVGTTEIPGIAEASIRSKLQPQERIYIALPGSMTAARGDRFIVIAYGPELPEGARVVIPTGVAQVERVNGRDAMTARLVAHYDEIRVGQSVIPIERFTVPTDVRPTPVERGAQTKVTYLPSPAVLQTLQRYVVLGATQAQGVRVGDQYTLYRPRYEIVENVAVPDEPIALVQVVRVTDRGASALIVDQRHPDIEVGTMARLTARMP